MFCKYCGVQLEGTPKFCPSCGGKLLAAATAVPVAPVQPVVPVAPVVQPTPEAQPESLQSVYAPVAPVQSQQGYQQQYQQAAYQGNLGTSGGGFCSFDGKGKELLLTLLLNGLLIIFTLGFGGPWAICNIMKWTKTHTIVNGRRLTFTGTGGQFFLQYLKWILLCLITFGIYGFWMYKDLKSWEVKHTFYADQNPQPGQESTTSFFDGTVGEYVKIALLGALCCLFTFGFYAPWLACKIYRWEMSHTVIDGDRLKFNGAGIDFLAEYLKLMFFTLITFGIYEAWGICAINRWAWGNTSIQSRGNHQT